MNLDNKEAKLMALEMAKQSPCNKRKVGACIVDQYDTIIGQGFNLSPAGPCEDITGVTYFDVIHAEVSAINSIVNTKVSIPTTIYVTHQPCSNCQESIKATGIIHTVIVEDFMKFDNTKLKYSLIPPSATKALAEVLTYGAKKYKPNNWQLVDDSSRYVDALYRHLEAWRLGEKLDPESGLSHLSHAMTNIVFLNHLENRN